MKILAITHAEKEAGVNPGLTETGKENIVAGAQKLLTKKLTHIIVGTGKRFNDVFNGVLSVIWGKLPCGPIEDVKYSPLLGSADSGTKTETGMDVFLADGTLVKIGDYIGLIGTPGINLVTWLESLPEGTLLCTGREFIGALGVKDAQMATVYEIEIIELPQGDGTAARVTAL
jgi:hypothetical protein